VATAAATSLSAAQAPADQPAARTDENSRIAHTLLLEKARGGRIDVYFAGDSITRRWGATDRPEFLANWTSNFFGWNAANFGWGADTTQNILWRLHNGELDNVHPRVIVLLAGTNNIGNMTSRDGEAAIVDTMRSKAPTATIILTAIFPRNDDIKLMPAIDATNRNLSALADGKTIRFLNINDKLADRDGTLYEGVLDDGLHPALAGYQIWADALKPIFTELLGPPGAEDHAPPPTGDPSR
jgi:lysophospholipase L1-like esterase